MCRLRRIHVQVSVGQHSREDNVTVSDLTRLHTLWYAHLSLQMFDVGAEAGDLCGLQSDELLHRDRTQQQRRQNWVGGAHVSMSVVAELGVELYDTGNRGVYSKAMTTFALDTFALSCVVCAGYKLTGRASSPPRA